MKNRQVAELVAVGIEELVVVDGRVLAENPFAIGIEVRLSRLALDLVAQSVLTLVGVGKIELVKEKQSHGKHRGSDQHWNDDAVDADAGSLHGGDLIRALHKPEGDDDGQHHAEMGDVVEEKRRDVEQIFADGERRNLVVKDVAKKFKEGEDQQKHDERGYDHAEIDDKIAQDIVVKDHWKTGAEKAAAPGGTFEGVLGGSGPQQAALPGTAFPGIPPALKSRNLEWAALNPPQQKASGDKEHDVGQPDSE